MDIDDSIHLPPRLFPPRRAPLASRYLDEIYPNLWLGSLQAAESAEILQTCGITDIISITSHRPRIPASLGIAKTHFRLRDNTDADLLSILPACIRKIEEVMSAAPAPGARERKVLVHCRMGISRSGGMVVAYAMKHANIPAPLALEFVRSRRPIVNPNKAFMAQLTVWGECGYDTALLLPDMAAPEAEPEAEPDEEVGEQDQEPSEEEMLQMALQMSLAAPEEPPAPRLLVVINPDGTPVMEAQDAEMADAAAATATVAGVAPHARLPDGDVDIDMHPPPPPPPATAAATARDSHPEQHTQKVAAAVEVEEQWVEVTMGHAMRQRFEACVRVVGAGGGRVDM